MTWDMPLSRETAQDDQYLVRYLLGLLPAEDADRIDEASIVDDDMAARLRRVEDDLVDAYVRGELSNGTAARFEAYYLSSPLRRERVRFARTFVPAVDRATVNAQRPRWRPRLPTWLSPLAVAAALLLVTSGTMLVETLRLSRGLSIAQSDRAAVERHAQELEAQLAGAKAATARATTEVERAREAITGAQEPIAISLVLAPQTRAAGSVPALTLPPRGDVVRFELQLESADLARYGVELRDPAANRIAWRGTVTLAKASAGQRSVYVAVPARLLKPQHYSIDLTGRGADGRSQIMGSYAFEVAAR
jgi:anti-sigma-K factor RskA